MSVTMAELLDLPSLREAKVIGGSGGLNKHVTSISVLEYSLANDMQERILNQIDFYGSELVVSALSDVADDVDGQIANIERLADIGSAGLILYYVGIIMDKVDPRLIEAADRLDYVLILMPEHRPDLRYSEVISEVTEAILLDRTSQAKYTAEIIERVSCLPVYQRNLNTVLSMLSDRIHASLFLADAAGQVTNSVAWPRNLRFDFETFLSSYDGSEAVISDGRPLFVSCLPLKLQERAGLTVYVLKQDARVSEIDQIQIAEVMQLAVNLWSEHKSEVVLPALVRAILQDEPYKMRRIASLFDIDVSRIHHMWTFTPRSGGDLSANGGGAVLSLIQSELRLSISTVVADIYDSRVVTFMDDPPDRSAIVTLAERLEKKLREAGHDLDITVGYNLSDTWQCRRAFLDTRQALASARVIWPCARVYTLPQIAFAQRCDRIALKGEDEVSRHTAVLNWIEDDNRASLVETLTVYLLDAGLDSGRTAELMYVHANTVKYRLGRIAERLCGDVEQIAVRVELATAVALRRILSLRPDAV